MFNKLIDKSGKGGFIYCIILVLIFAFSACGNDDESDANGPVPAELIGTWIKTGDDGDYDSYTFKNDLVRYYSKDTANPDPSLCESYYELTKSLIFEKNNNTDPTTQSAFPAGYSFEGEVTSATGTMSLGSILTNNIFLNNGKNKFSVDTTSSIFTKQ